MRKYKPSIAVLNEARRAFPILCAVKLDLACTKIFITTKYNNTLQYRQVFFVYDSDAETFTPILLNRGIYTFCGIGKNLPRYVYGIQIIPSIVADYAGLPLSIEFMYE